MTFLHVMMERVQLKEADSVSNDSDTDSCLFIYLVSGLVCIVAHNVYSIIIAASFLIHKKVYQFTCTEQKAADNSDVHRIVGPLYGPCFMSHFWRLEFGGEF
jgi:hypothetical protein